MKQIKILLMPLLVFCAAALMSSTAQASLAEPGTTGSITIYSLAVEDLGEYQTPATGEETTADGEPLANISYTVTRVADDATAPADAQAVTGDGAYNETIATDAYGRARFEDLTLGVYLVHQEDSAAVEEAVADFLVDVPMTSPAGTSLIYNVNIYPKYQLPGLPGVRAYVTEADNKYDSTDLGGRSTWILAAQIPADIATAQQFELQSALHQYLTFTDGSTAVYGEADGAQRVTLALDTDYLAEAREQVLHITLQESGRKKLEGLAATAGATVYAEFDTTLTIPAAALDGMLGEQIGVGAQLAYTSSLGRPGTSDATDSAPYIYTGGVGIAKSAYSNGEPLEGAAFKIYRTDADAAAQQNAIQSPDGDGDWVMITNEEGTTAFAGLAYGGKGIPNTEGNTKYYLVQTLAPAGYNLLRAPVEITVDASSHLEENNVKIQGKSGFLLPATGGMGTFWFTVIGLLIIGLAIFLFWRARKKKPESDRP